MQPILKWLLIAGIIGLILSPFLAGLYIFIEYQSQQKTLELPYGENKSYWNQSILLGFLFGIPIIAIAAVLIGAFSWTIIKTRPGVVIQGILLSIILYYIVPFLLFLLIGLILLILTGGLILFAGGVGSPLWLVITRMIFSMVAYLGSLFLFHRLRKDKLFSIGLMIGLGIAIILFILKLLSY